jgi:hypothetical protein
LIILCDKKQAVQEKTLQDITLGRSSPVLSTELSTEIVGKKKILFRNEGLANNCAMSDFAEPEFF